jgi:y4mF family transcriptional regulator
VLGSQVRARRKSRGLTQRQLATVAGCSAKFLTDLENGKPSVRFDKTLAVVKTLGLDLYIDLRGDIKS